MTPPEKESPLFIPTRAKIIETPYKKADSMAKVADKLFRLSVKRDKKSLHCFSFHEPLWIQGKNYAYVNVVSLLSPHYVKEMN
jgi:hypothetical protein